LQLLPSRKVDCACPRKRGRSLGWYFLWTH
jgi:hypothetical protein